MTSYISSLIQHCAKDGPLAQVCPEDPLLGEVCIQCHRVPQLLHDLGVLPPLQTQLPDVPTVSEDKTGLLAHSLAHSCGGVHLVAVVALTLITSLQVDTNLTTDPRVHTFIDVSTGLAVYELQSRGAVTLEANHHVPADVGAPSVVQQTLVQVALFDGLVAPVWTVPGLVAHFIHLYTLSTPTLEFVRAIALCQVFAVDFIGAICTITQTVALSAAVDTVAVLTLELVRSAGTNRTVGFVTAILAVWVPVTSPLAVDALPRPTLCLAGRTFGRRRGLATTSLRGLIRLVLAVHVIVTDPVARDTGGIATLELAGTTGGWSTFLLITPVTTVILPVTDEVTGDAAAARTGELQRGARDVTTAHFILSVIAVLLSITLPEDGDALGGTGPTAKLIHTAGPGVAHFHMLIRPILTVWLSVAVPSLGDALAITTDKVHLRTGLPNAGVLVTPVGAVLIPVTLPDRRDAATVPTLELTGLTFCL